MRNRRSLVVALHDGEGHVGWGEAPPFELPFYSEETLAGARHLLTEVLIPGWSAATSIHPTRSTRCFAPASGATRSRDRRSTPRCGISSPAGGAPGSPRWSPSAWESSRQPPSPAASRSASRTTGRPPRSGAGSTTRWPRDTAGSRSRSHPAGMPCRWRRLRSRWRAPACRSPSMPTARTSGPATKPRSGPSTSGAALLRAAARAR